MFALDPNVAGQSAQPFWGETAPHDQTHERHDHAENENVSSEFAHTGTRTKDTKQTTDMLKIICGLGDLRGCRASNYCANCADAQR